MKRRLLNLVTALSLLLCIACLAMWVRSYWGVETLSRFSRSHYVEATSAGGTIEVRRFTYARPVDRPPQGMRLRYTRQPRAHGGRGTVGGRVGFGSGQLRRPDGGYVMDLYVVPWWSVALLAALPAAPLLWRWRRVRLRGRRAARGLCPSCGYDLRATPGRCPECGTNGGAEPVGGARS